MLRKAVEWGYLKESPAATVKKLKSGAAHFRYLNGDEINALLDIVRESENPFLYPFVVDGFNTGMRLGEIDGSGVEGH